MEKTDLVRLTKITEHLNYIANDLYKGVSNERLYTMNFKDFNHKELYKGVNEEIIDNAIIAYREKLEMELKTLVNKDEDEF
jgi:hypothetical protein